MTNKDHIERTKRMIEVMQAYVDGERIESYYGAIDNPGWMWCEVDKYRIVKTPDTINWDHVAPEFKYMARGEEGESYLYKSKPEQHYNEWLSMDIMLGSKYFASYKRGTVDWKESLVIRPG